jgi:hypothetical protein
LLKQQSCQLTPAALYLFFPHGNQSLKEEKFFGFHDYGLIITWESVKVINFDITNKLFRITMHVCLLYFPQSHGRVVGIAHAAAYSGTAGSFAQGNGNRFIRAFSEYIVTGFRHDLDLHLILPLLQRFCPTFLFFHKHQTDASKIKTDPKGRYYN